MLRSVLMCWMWFMGLNARLIAQVELTMSGGDTGPQVIFHVSRFDTVSGTYWKGLSFTKEGSRPIGPFEVRDTFGHLLQRGQYTSNGFPDSVWMWYTGNGICVQKDSFSGRSKWRTRFDSLQGYRCWQAKLNEHDRPEDTVFTYFDNGQIASKRYRAIQQRSFYYAIEFYPNGRPKTELLKQGSRVIFGRYWGPDGKRSSYQGAQKEGRPPPALAQKMAQQIPCLQQQEIHGNIDLVVTLSPEGKPNEVEVLGLSPSDCTQQLIEWVLASTGWQAARKSGKPVWSTIRIPIGFLRYY